MRVREEETPIDHGSALEWKPVGPETGSTFPATPQSDFFFFIIIIILFFNLFLFN